MPSISPLIVELRILTGHGISEEYDEDQPRASDGKWTSGGSKKDSDLSPKQIDRIKQARDQARSNLRFLARADFLKKQGLGVGAWLSGEQEKEVDQVLSKISPDEIKSREDEAERRVRDEFEEDLEDDRKIAAATKAGYLHPLASKNLDELKKFSGSTADDIDSRVEELKKAQRAAAEALTALDAFNTQDVSGHEDEDGLNLPFDLDDTFDQMRSTTQLVQRTGDQFRAAAAGVTEDEISEREEEPPYDENSSIEVPPLPDFVEPEDVMSPPEKAVEDGEVDENDEEEYDAYVQAYEEQQKKIKDFDSAYKSRESAYRKQAGVAQAALEKVHALQTSAVDTAKASLPRLKKFAKAAEKEVPEESYELVKADAFGLDSDQDPDDIEDDELRKKYDDAQRAAEVQITRRADFLNDLSVSFETSDARSHMKELASVIKDLAAISGVPSALAKPSKAKSKGKVPDDEDESDEDDED